MTLAEWLKLLLPYAVEIVKAIFGSHSTAVQALRDQGKL